MGKPKQSNNKGERSKNWHLKTKKKTGPECPGLLQAMTASADDANKELNARYIRVFGPLSKKRPITIQERNEALYNRSLLTITR